MGSPWVLFFPKYDSWLSGYLKLHLGVFVCLHCCLFHVSLWCPVMDWGPVQSGPYFSTNKCWGHTPVDPAYILYKIWFGPDPTGPPRSGGIGQLSNNFWDCLRFFTVWRNFQREQPLRHSNKMSKQANSFTYKRTRAPPCSPVYAGT